MFECTKYFIIDIDGTFCLDDTLISGADDCLRGLARHGKDYVFFTNNSSKSAESVCTRLSSLGFPVSKEKVILSSDVTADYIRRTYPDKTVYVLGNRNLCACLQKAGIPLVQDAPDIVLAGLDTDVTYARLCSASRFLENGALFLATHPDVACPTPEGVVPDAGALIGLLTAVTGVQPHVLGKPMTPTVEYLQQRLGCRLEELAFVGDRLETDIRIGNAHGVPAVLVLSGVTNEAMLQDSPDVPDLVLSSLRDLVSCLP